MFFSALFASACFLPAALIPNEPAGGLEGVLVALAAASPFAFVSALEALYAFAASNAAFSVAL